MLLCSVLCCESAVMPSMYSFVYYYNSEANFHIIVFEGTTYYQNSSPNVVSNNAAVDEFQTIFQIAHKYSLLHGCWQSPSRHSAPTELVKDGPRNVGYTQTNNKHAAILSLQFFVSHLSYFVTYYIVCYGKNYFCFILFQLSR